MKRKIILGFGLVIFFVFGFFLNNMIAKPGESKGVVNENLSQNTINTKEGNLKLGAFSVSLNVKDLKASKSFYENLGFEILAGGFEMNYFIMKNENSVIGIFQGMFENNILTFNPGWDENGQNIESFDDIRDIQQKLISKGIQIDKEVDVKTSGPASFVISDPDGNLILFDQHR